MNDRTRSQRPPAGKLARRLLAAASFAVAGLLAAGCSLPIGQASTGWPRLPATPAIAIVSLPPETPTPSPTVRPTPTATPTPSPTPKPTATSARTKGPTRPPGPTPPPGYVVLPTYADRVAATSVVHYSITGSTEDALIKGMETNVPSTCEADALACFTYQFSWSYTTQTSGGTCAVTSVNLTKTYTMVLPLWSGPAVVPSRLAVWWGKVHDHIFWHENQHLALANGFIPSLESGIKSGPCDPTASQQNASNLLAKLEAQQKAFDTSDSGWTWPAY